jgi:hypothetical protein
LSLFVVLCVVLPHSTELLDPNNLATKVGKIVWTETNYYPREMPYWQAYW